eukprot:11417006-Alexandrium_andersonii.AAC.1
MDASAYRRSLACAWAQPLGHIQACACVARIALVHGASVTTLREQPQHATPEPVCVLEVQAGV